MFNVFTKTTAIAATAFSAAFLGFIAHPSTAEAGNFKLCANGQSGSLCLQANGGQGGIMFKKKTQGDYQLAQSAASLTSGNYFGTWKDGTNMVERIVMRNGTLTMQRIAGGHGSGTAGPTVKFYQIGANEFSNRNGSVVYIVSPTTFTWRNNNNGNHVFYQLMN